MSSEQSGAIILTVFYILDLDKKSDNYFTPSYISNRYNELLRQYPHGERIKNIIKSRKKHSGKNTIKTLEETSRTRNWLNMHTNTKKIFWFIARNGEFKLKPEYIEALNNLIKPYKT